MMVEGPAGLAPLRLPQLQVTRSFMEAEGEASPPASGSHSLRTPAPPDITASRWRKGLQSQSSSQGRRASLADSQLSDLPTYQASEGGNLQRSLSITGELESPNVRSEPPEERRVPSCPQKQSGSSAKRQTMPPPGLVRDESEEIRPRTLDLDDTDPIESLSLSPMNMASPGEHGKAREGSSLSGIDHSMVNARPVRDVANVRQPPEAIAGSRENAKRVKRNDEMDPFLERQNACENLDYLRFSVPVPLAANRANSMADTKMLFTRQDGLCQTESFCALPGAEHQFTFEDHFDWLYKLGSGSFCDVYAVEHKTRKGERYAIKYSKREFKSRNERAEHLKEVQLACKMPVHSNVVEYFRAWQESYVFYVQMELCANGTLRHLLTRDGHTLKLPGAESRVWEMTTHIARGLAHIHSYEVMHCDLKPDNILISGDGVFKIGDLGHATGLKAWDEQARRAREPRAPAVVATPSPAFPPHPLPSTANRLFCTPRTPVALQTPIAYPFAFRRATLAT